MFYVVAPNYVIGAYSSESDAMREKSRRRSEAWFEFILVLEAPNENHARAMAKAEHARIKSATGREWKN